MTAPAPYPPIDDTAHCRRPGVDPGRFHPTKGDNGSTVATTKKLCTGGGKIPPCPFLDGCSEYGITHAVHGIWGGLGEDGRKAARKARSIVPVALKTSELVGERPGGKSQALHPSPGAIGIHSRRREPLCDACRDFRNERRRVARAKKRADACALVRCEVCRKEMRPKSLPRHRRDMHGKEAA